MITLEQIFNETHSQVFNHVRRVVKKYHDAEDVCSDVYIKIQKLMAKDSTRFDETKSSLSTWVHTVTNSVILDFFRTNHQNYYQAVSDFNDDQKDGRSFLQFIAPANVNADSLVLTDELHDKIAKAFRALKPKYRKIATLYFLREMEYSEIAEIMNVPMGTVKGMISRARQVLQTELEGTRNYKAVNVQNTNI